MTDDELKQLVANLSISQQETDKQLRATDQQIKATSQQLEASKKEVDKQPVGWDTTQVRRI